MEVSGPHRPHDMCLIFKDHDITLGSQVRAMKPSANMTACAALDPGPNNSASLLRR